MLHVQSRRLVVGTPRHPRVSPPLPFFSPSSLPRLFFLRPFASSFHTSCVVPPQLAWFRSSWLHSCRPSCGSSPFEGETRKDQVGVLLESNAGFSWRCFPCFPAVRGTGTKVRGTGERGMGGTGERCFPSCPSVWNPTRVCFPAVWVCFLENPGGKQNGSGFVSPGESVAFSW